MRDGRRIAGPLAVIGGAALVLSGLGAATLAPAGIAPALVVPGLLGALAAAGVILVLPLGRAMARPGADPPAGAGRVTDRRVADAGAWVAIAGAVAGAVMLLVASFGAGLRDAPPVGTGAGPGSGPASSSPPEGGRGCPASLQGLVDAAAPGGVVTAPACLYRETVTVSKPLTLRAAPGAEIRGSDAWTAWTRTDGGWDSARRVTAVEARGTCAPGTDRCHVAQQAFIDGAPQRYVAGERPGPGEFAVLADGRIRLGSDPSAALVEVSTRELWVHVTAPDVTVEGFTMRHSTVPAQAGGITVGGFGAAPVDRATIRACRLFDAHGALVSIQGGSGHAVVDSTLERGGQLGLHLSGDGGSRDWLVQGNVIADNATDGFDVGWEAGGLKALHVDGLRIIDNEFAGGPHGANGRGAWTDTGTSDVVFTGNRLHDNGYQGAMFESSHGLRIEDNVAWGNGWLGPEWAWGGGIVLSSSDHALVKGNLVAWNADGISVVSQDRDDDAAHEDIVVEGNTILVADRPLDPDGFALAWVQDWAGILCDPAAGNLGRDNLAWDPRAGSRAFAWCGPPLDLAAMTGAAGGTGTRSLDTPDAMAIAAAAGVPWTPEAPTGPAVARTATAARVAGADLAIAGLAVLGLVGVARRRGRTRIAALIATVASAAALPGGGTGIAALLLGSGWAAAGLAWMWPGRADAAAGDPAESPASPAGPAAGAKLGG